ncbi:unnamed protein product [Ixodes persulcatus]
MCHRAQSRRYEWKPAPGESRGSRDTSTREPPVRQRSAPSNEAVTRKSAARERPSTQRCAGCELLPEHPLRRNRGGGGAPTRGREA